MNEQDIIKHIENETKDLPIPDSISPSNMEKMLQEHMAQEDSVKDNSENHEKKYSQGNNKDHKYGDLKSTMTAMRRKRIGLAFAACFGVIIIGSGALGIIKNNNNNKTAEESAGETAANYDTANYDFAEDVLSEEQLSDEESENAENEQMEKNLIASGAFSKPDSYEDYYDTLFDAYQNNIGKYEDFEPFDSGNYVEEAIEDAAIVTEDSAPSNEAATGASKGSDTSGSNDYSATNTQEQSIDEGDIVKTDGEYIYTVNGDNYYYGSDYLPTISITKAVNGKLTDISTIDLQLPKASENVSYYMFNEFYIYNNYLIVLYQITALQKGDIYDDVHNEYNYNNLIYTDQSCIDIYDITNKQTPKKIKTLYQSGGFRTSRISDGYLYTISYFIPESMAFKDYDKGRTDYPDYIPYINDDTISYDDIYYSKHLDSIGTYVITCLDLNNPDKFTDAKAVSSSGSDIYAGEKSIYIYGTIYDNVEKTEILRIAYDKGNLYIGNRAMVAGYLYGSFALSEYDDHLRIVSTIPANDYSWYDKKVWTDTSKQDFGYRINEDVNAVYVLDENMHMTGRITGLAPGEKIYSARFFGNIGYFVTYKNMDPLFSVDFSDPNEPKILGQLKIPGFSNYLHFYGSDTLLGIGEEINPKTQDFKGLKLSMFNIGNPADVKEEDKLILDNVYYSSAQYDYKSIMIDPQKNVFGFCFEAEDYDQYGDYAYNYYYATYTYDPDTGFTETARYKIDYDYMYDISYIRGIFIGDYFYLVTPQSIESYKLGSDEMIDRTYLD